MTPKEKAEELFNKFDSIIYTDQDNWKQQVKSCAKSTVDSLLTEVDWYALPGCLEEYWQEVKNEIDLIK